MKRLLIVAFVAWSTTAHALSSFDEGCDEAKDQTERQQCIDGNIKYQQQQMMEAFDKLKELTPAEKLESVLVAQMEFQSNLTTECTGTKRDVCLFDKMSERTTAIKSKAIRPRKTNWVDEFCEGAVGDKFDACMNESHQMATKAATMSLDSLKVAVDKEERLALESEQDTTDKAFNAYIEKQCGFTKNPLKQNQCKYFATILRAGLFMNQLEMITGSK